MTAAFVVLVVAIVSFIAGIWAAKSGKIVVK